MVVGGGGDGHYKVEVIDLSGELKGCPAVTSFPLDEGSVGTFFDNRALVCGGEYPEELSNNCYYYDYEVRKYFCNYKRQNVR